MSQTFFTLPQETWDAKTCEKKSRHTHEDSYGTKLHFKGYLGSSASIPPFFGKIRYNGGCVHDGQWYDGEIRPFPVLAKGYEIVVVPSWGWRIQKHRTT
jgi:hypothetical protein